VSNIEKALHIRFQLRSAVDLERAGPWKYAAHPSSDVLGVSYAVGDGTVSRWHPSEPVPAEILAHVAAGSPVVAYDAALTRAVWHHVLVARYGWPASRFDQYFSLASMAASLALPDSPGEAAKVLGLSSGKDDANRRLTEQIGCWEDQKRQPRMEADCDAKVEAERAFLKAILPLLLLTPSEREVWLLDQRMNERGITVDLELVRRAQAIVEETKAKLDVELHQLTEGSVIATTQIEKLRAWCRGIQALQLGTLNHGEIKKVLTRELDLDPRVRRALEIRLQASKTSTSKLPSFLDRTGNDGRMRDNLVYHGASTGRWTAEGAGLQNLPARHSFKEIPQAIEVIKGGCSADTLSLVAPPLEIVSACLRGMLIAAPGHELIAADYNAVEARGLAWVAGASKMLDIFQRGECPYRHMASLIYHQPPPSFDPSGRERQLGKKAILGLGYNMGWETFLESCEKEGMFIKPQETSEIVRVYREANPEIPNLWREFEQAAIEAVYNAGKLIHCAQGRITFGKFGSWLYMRLPSGRLLAYNSPELRKQEKRWGGPDSKQSQKWGISFYGTDRDTRKWSQQNAYGGMWVQNATQGLCRDLLANAMLNLEASGYPIVLCVHDEIVAEVPEGTGDIAEFNRIMCDAPEWAAGLPLKAEGWRDRRYRK
jgi:DNA polymerase